ncbi:MAG: PhzF family phenazine biosynthesis protein [Pseudomonadota bacterium]
MAHKYKIYDVFTDTALEGNPLAVVFDADDLDTARMQAIAGEFNLSETIFFIAPEDPQHTVGARIFTPKSELPFAGHPTVGGAVAFCAHRGDHDDQLVLELPAGPVACSVALSPSHGETSFDAPLAPRITEENVDTGAIARALGLRPDELGFGGFAPVRATSGPNFTIVPIREPARLADIALDHNSWRQAFGEVGRSAYCIAPTGEATFQARMFAPLDGIPEDPATGSAAVAFAALLGRASSGAHSYTIRQGLEMGRPSTLAITVEAEGGTVSRVRLSGSAVLVAEGTLHL